MFLDEYPASQNPFSDQFIEQLEVLYKIGVLKDFEKFIGKHLYWSLFF